jgi:tetratricopeptide (TPR) repeat protein
MSTRENAPMKLAATLTMALALTAAPTLGVGQSSGQSSPQGGASQTAGRAPIQTKTTAEYQAYQAAIANAKNPDAMEKAADDFAAKFPDSAVRVLLHRLAMNAYQNAGNAQKMMEVGLKVLNLDKDDPEALISVAEVLQEQTSPTDLDKDKRATRAIDYAKHALETIDTDLAVPAGTAPERVEAYKKTLRSTAFAIIGTVQYKQEQYADAEANLRKAIDADSANPDPVVVLRLALALDQQKRYTDALQLANRAVELTQEGTEVGKMARNERDRLVIQTGGSTPPNSSPQNSNSSSH